ncbi:hypothetical protein ND16A_1770 [Thalassotalea sp. ND16A]|nr:hypothetical protein ND16A_1770 [Thalassotalea sp. ND16A]
MSYALVSSLRICWYLDFESKQGIYEYRNSALETNGFAITSELQKQLPQEFNQKYFDATQRGLIFSFFYNEIHDFVMENIDDLKFFNFTGVSKAIFFGLESLENWLDLCEQS